MVVIQVLVGAQVACQTAVCLAATPGNLGHGHRVGIEFGIGNRHKADAVGSVVDRMGDGIAAHFGKIPSNEELLGVDVEFLRAGASSLDYEVEIEVAGRAAHRFEELERELARCMVKIVNAESWEIPFQQSVIHDRARPAGYCFKLREYWLRR